MDRDCRRLLLPSAALAVVIVLAGVAAAKLVTGVEAVLALLLAGSAWCALFMVFGVAQLGKAYSSSSVESALAPAEVSEVLAGDPVQAMDVV